MSWKTGLPETGQLYLTRSVLDPGMLKGETVIERLTDQKCLSNPATSINGDEFRILGCERL